MLKTCWSGLLFFAALHFGEVDTVPTPVYWNNPNSTWFEGAQGQKQAMSLLCLLAVYGRVDVQFIKFALGKSRAGKHPLHGEPHLSTGCCFLCPCTHLSPQLKRAELLLPGVNNQCPSPKDSFWARATTLLHRGVYTLAYTWYFGRREGSPLCCAGNQSLS